MGRKSRRSDNPAVNLFKRLQWAHKTSKQTGVPADELLDRLKEQQKIQHAQRAERREFVKHMGLGVAAAGALGAAAPSFAGKGGKPKPPPSGNVGVAIIGGGLAGLRCAHRLQQYGISSKIYEANTRIGGRCFTTRGFFDNGMNVERGGELISTEHSATRNLVNALGLTLEDVGGGALPGGEELYYVNNQLYTEAQLEDDWRDIYPLFGNTESAAPWQPTYDNHNAEHVRLDYINANDWMDQVGIGANSNFGQLMQADLISEYGLAPEEQTCLNLVYLLAWNSINNPLPLAGTDERYHIVGGNDALVYALADELPNDSIVTGKALTAITGAAQGPYTCTFSDGSTTTADKLVLALPFTKLREVDIAPAIWNTFSSAKQQAINEMSIGANGKIHVQTDSRPWSGVRNVNGHDIQMNGVSYSGGDGFVTVWDTQVNGSTTGSVMCDYLGGHQGRNLSGSQPFSSSKRTDVNKFLGQIEPVFPGTTAAYENKALTSKWSVNPWSKGSYSTPGLGQFTSFWGAQWEKETSNNVHFCGEHTSVEYWGFLQGAVETGERVATEIHQG
ncbi:FAD-dependent oxidoreductase [Dasania sp. GY-MA-18]|uniref:Tryptophan 2-monooxygenase n=1 Tax=Dasania phycosphaerae TaxID=2950436 RepID=A0A9J6RLG5_9GAMM|nr:MULTISPECIES: NAD(P)/FAD-dependent oxidoreductase [Dasania]MCR8922837.1 FAD-dependent oxidoreductase [Dasania sp. GY-MA-18]MCZ0865268.1 NAD(P)/FAD-dependent oxidoreductase [Dasania phycosphaerae]MCZ0868993.1 NAD(P)/FAD-dependent oxidoreductase [Dasania phycosphaerae]